MAPKYRAEIDGLRAVAVLSVLFFHLGISFFSGGYVGVDIFFVISGYLITSIIIRKIENNDFSIIEFYERRFRRILPALTIVIFVSLVMGALLLTPESVIDLGQSAIASAIFSSNILFYFEAGYFDKPAELKPLLHTWSLAVEEQFYIFFPLLLILIAKINTRYYLKCLVFLGILSFVACAILTKLYPSVAFYWIPTRAWELIIGSILALQVIPVPKNRLMRETISLSGIIMIFYSVLKYTPDTVFPGIAAVLPTMGTALIIYASCGGQSLISRILSLSPFVFIGVISYSLYLWHWPVITYTKILSIKEPTETVMAIAFIAILFLSILSWKYIELPFRKKVLLPGRRSLLWTSVTVSLVIISSGLFFVTTDGTPYKTKEHTVSKAKIAGYKWKRWKACENVVRKVNNDQRLCAIGKKSDRASFIVWGDSHARALASGIDLSAKNNGEAGIIATQSACPPLLSIERPNRTSCNEFNQAVLKVIANTPEIDTVILAARWVLSTKGTRYKNEDGKPIQLVDMQSANNGYLSNAELFEIGLMRTIGHLLYLGKKVILVNPIPEIGYDVPAAKVVTDLTGRDINGIIAPTKDEYRQRTAEVMFVFNKLTGNRAIDRVTPEIYLCDNKHCRAAIDGVPLYLDDDHLSTFGSEYLSKAFDRIFSKKYDPRGNLGDQNIRL